MRLLKLETVTKIKEILPNVEGIDNRDQDVLIIDRRFWSRGTPGSSLLSPFVGTFVFEPTVKMCCLGFRCLELGIEPEYIIDRASPASILKGLPELLEKVTDLVTTGDGFGTFESSPIVIELIDINDSHIGTVVTVDGTSVELLSEAHREELVADRFSKLGVEVRFVN